MSRYICHFLVKLAPPNVRIQVRALLESCQMETIYEIEDYVIAREIPGQVSSTKLVTAEVSIGSANASKDAVTLSFVVKNEELPLDRNNHCHQIFDRLRASIEQHKGWQPITSLQPLSTQPGTEIGKNA